MSPTTTSDNIAERELVVFRIGDEEFAIDIKDVREIIKYSDVTQIPDVATYIQGIINLRGKIVVVINLREKLSLDSAENTDKSRIIISEQDTNTIGLVVDGCNEVLRVSKDKIEIAPESIHEKINSDYIEGICVLDKRLIIILEVGKVIRTDDMRQISKIRNKHAKKE